MSVDVVALFQLPEALYIWFSLEHSKTKVTANMETISVFSFDGHQIGKPRFTKIGRSS